ncbi:MAG: hypothetical protein M0P64_03630 [Candidatus Pacebacteria bacterium]|nr:hypothetical protein [Candidatus Paceibacterota bacterium]
MNIVILFLFLIAGAAAGAIWVVQEWDQIDRALCTRTPWYFRLWWCALWVRKDILHPSFLPDTLAFEKLVNWERFKMRLKMNTRAAFGIRETTAQKDATMDKLNKLPRVLRKQYINELDTRRETARKRDPENRPTQSPSQ